MTEEQTEKPPWPSYDRPTSSWMIAALAVRTGLVEEAIRYELLTRNRPDVVAALEKARAAPKPAAAVVDREKPAVDDWFSNDEEDYLPKLFAFAELVARIRALARTDPPRCRVPPRGGRHSAGHRPPVR